MYRGRFTAFAWRVFLSCLWALVAAQASVFAASSPPSAPGAAGFEPPAMLLAKNTDALGAGYFAVRADAPQDLTIEQIAAPGAVGFVPFNPALTYKLSKSNALWLHFRVQQGKTGPTDWTVVLSKPFIDRAEFYFQDAQGIWRMQTAGTTVAHQRWPAKGLTPQFRLNESLELAAAGASLVKPQDFYIRIQKWIPLRFAVDVQRNDTVSEQTQNTFLVIGLLLGLLGFMVVLGCVLSVLYRNLAYAWYAAYAFCALMAAASFSGIGSYVFWPTTVVWPAISTMVFVMLGLTAQLAFTRAIFIAPRTPKVWAYLLLVAAALMLLASAVFVAVDQPRLRLALFGLAVPAGFVIIAAIAIRALRYDRPVATLYLLPFAPMLAVVGLTQVEQLGIAALPWLPYNAPIYGLVLELPLLLVALHLHAKKTHTQAVRSITLAHTDPLTGFVASAQYRNALTGLWDAALDAGADLTVVYVKVVSGYADTSLAATSNARQDVLRCVRMLRTVARDDDTIARVDERVFAMLMPGVSRSERLASKLSRLVALGVMVDADDPRSRPIKFKIVASTRRTFLSDSATLDEALKSVLGKTDVISSRVISYVSKQPRQAIEVASGGS